MWSLVPTPDLISSSLVSLRSISRPFCVAYDTMKCIDEESPNINAACSPAQNVLTVWKANKHNSPNEQTAAQFDAHRVLAGHLVRSRCAEATRPGFVMPKVVFLKWR